MVSFPVWKIARATSSIPLVIAPVQIGNYQYMDGGLVSNNPTINILTDIERMREQTSEEVSQAYAYS
jgi:predicted acylesterase/phospholipase RssA